MFYRCFNPFYMKVEGCKALAPATGSINPDIFNELSLLSSPLLSTNPEEYHG